MNNEDKREQQIKFEKNLITFQRKHIKVYSLLMF